MAPIITAAAAPGPRVPLLRLLLLLRLLRPPAMPVRARPRPAASLPSPHMPVPQVHLMVPVPVPVPISVRDSPPPVVTATLCPSAKLLPVRVPGPIPLPLPLLLPHKLHVRRDLRLAPPVRPHVHVHALPYMRWRAVLLPVTVHARTGHVEGVRGVRLVDGVTLPSKATLPLQLLLVRPVVVWVVKRARAAT